MTPEKGVHGMVFMSHVYLCSCLPLFVKNSQDVLYVFALHQQEHHFPMKSFEPVGSMYCIHICSEKVWAGWYTSVTLYGYQERWRELPPEFRSLHLGRNQETSERFCHCRIYIYIATTRLHDEFGVYTQQIWNLKVNLLAWMPRLLKTCGDCSCNTRGFTFGKILVAWSRMFPYHLPMTYQFQGSKWGLCEGINIKVFHKTIPHPFLNTIPMISPLWMFFIWSEKERKNIWTYKVPQFSRSNLIVVSAHVIKQTARFPLCFLRCLKEALLLNPSPAASYATWMKSWDKHDDVWAIPIGRCIYYIYIY